MATSPSKAEIGLPQELKTALASPEIPDSGAQENSVSGRDALQALLAFSALQQQVRQRRAPDSVLPGTSHASENPDQLLLFEVLQLVAERALALTGADGIAIALVHNGEIICRAASGPMAPDVGVKLDVSAGFSGLCLRSGESVRCDDAENDPRVDRQASHRLKARSMLAVPLCGRHSVLGLIEAFSAEAYGFTESDLGSLKLLAELILGAMKPEEQDKLESLSPVAVHGKKLAAEIKPPAPAVVGLRSPERVPALGAAGLDALIREQLQAATGPNLASTATALPAAPPKSETPLPDNATASCSAAESSEPGNQAQEKVVEEPQAPEFAILGVPSTKRKSQTLVVLGAVAGLALAFSAGMWWKQQRKTPAVAAGISSPPSPVASQAAVSSPALPLSSSTLPAENSTPTVASANEGGRNLLPAVTGVRHWESEDSSTVVIDLQDAVQYEVHRLSNPERIYFDLHDTVLSAGLSGKTIEVGDSLLIRIRIAQPMAGVSRVVLETKDSSNFSVTLERNPLRLVASIRKQGVERKLGTKIGIGASEMQERISDAKTSIPSKEDLQLRARVPHLKIVIDAGHGGWDLGTVGREGMLEKDLVFDVAKRLGVLLENRVATEVIYTRPDDNYIPLEQRAEIANQAQADLFVSIHANNSDYSFARGVETYYTSYSSSPETAAIEKQENGTTKAISDGGVLSEVALKERKERTDESRRLAVSVERALYGTLSSDNPGMRDRGVRQAKFVVLTGTSMPAILSEISFVSSPMDEKKLQSAAYRQQIAEALYKGIARYAASSSRVKMAAASAKPTGR